MTAGLGGAEATLRGRLVPESRHRRTIINTGNPLLGSFGVWCMTIAWVRKKYFDILNRRQRAEANSDSHKRKQTDYG